MAEKRGRQTRVSIEALRPTDTQWKEWQESRNAMFWHAALLTLKVHPSVENRTVLQDKFPELYEEYLRRLIVLRRRSLSLASLGPNGKKCHISLPLPSRYVSLPAVAKFASQQRWDTDAELLGKLLPETKVKTLDGSGAVSMAELGIDETLDGMNRGLLLTLVRYAALVSALRTAIDSPQVFAAIRKEALGKRKNVSNQALGLIVARSVATFANEKGKGRITAGFGKDKNADEIAKAYKVVSGMF